MRAIAWVATEAPHRFGRIRDDAAGRERSGHGGHGFHVDAHGQ